MASDANEFVPMDQLNFYMSMFDHLRSVNPTFFFKEPPVPGVRQAQKRSIYDFFISYRHEISRVYAEKISNELKEFGYNVYFAGQVPEFESLNDEVVIREKLASAMHKSSVFVIIGNRNMLESEWVYWEMDTFYDNHFGRKVPIIADDMGSPIDNDGSLEQLALKNIRDWDLSAALIYEEGKDAWKNQKPSAMTIFCLLLVREFYRVELEFWHNWKPMNNEARTQAYLRSLYEDGLCNWIMAHTLGGDNDNSLADLKERYPKLRSVFRPIKRKTFNIYVFLKAIKWPFVSD